MPSSAAPSPLDQLAGIEQMLDAYRDAVWQNGKVYGLDSVSHYHEQDDADEETPRKAILATLATLREVLTEWRAFLVESRARVVELVSYTDDQRAAIGYTLDTITAAWDKEIAALLTPDSPRQAGEEN